MKGRALHLAGNLAGLLAGIITAPLTARALGPEGRGEVAVVVVVSTILMTTAAVGLPWLARTELTHDPHSLSFWRGPARRVGLFLLPVAALAGVVTALLVGLGPGELAATIAVFAIGVFAAARGIEANALISTGRSAHFGAANVAAAVLTVASIVTFFAMGNLTVAVVLWTTFVSVAVQVALTVAFVRRATKDSTGELEARAAELTADPDHSGRALASRAGRAWSAQVAESITTRADTATVALSAVSAQVGLYSVVALIPQAAYAVFTTVVQAAFARRRGGDELTRFSHVVQACLVLALALAALAAPVAWWALPLVFGEEFTAARAYLPGALAITVALGSFAPVVLHMSSGRARVLPILAILIPAAAAATVGALAAGPEWAVVALGAALLIASLGYAAVVTSGSVLRVDLSDSRRWWRGEDE